MATRKFTVPSARSDPAYQLQLTELARQKSDMAAGQHLADSQYTGQFNQQARQLGRVGNHWDPNLPNGQYGIATNANTNDFAGRGMIHSGAYVHERGRIQDDFNSQYNNMLTARNDFRNTQGQSMRNLDSSQEALRQQGLSAAVAALAAKYGINTNQVPQGAKGTTITRQV